MGEFFGNTYGMCPGVPQLHDPHLFTSIALGSKKKTLRKISQSVDLRRILLLQLSEQKEEPGFFGGDFSPFPLGLLDLVALEEGRG